MNQTDQRATMLDQEILTKNWLHAKLCSTNTRAIAQLVEHLVYTCANVFQGSSSCNQKTWLTNQCLTLLLCGNKRTIAWQLVQSNSGVHLVVKSNALLIWDSDRVNNQPIQC